MGKKINWRARVAEEEQRLEAVRRNEFVSFFQEGQKFIKNEKNNFDAVGYNTYGKTYEAFKNTSFGWNEKAAKAKSYLESISSYLPAEEYKGYIDEIEKFGKILNAFDQDYKAKGDYYSQFDSEFDMQMLEKYANADFSTIEHNRLIGDISKEEKEWLEKNRLNYVSKDSLEKLLEEYDTWKKEYEVAEKAGNNPGAPVFTEKDLRDQNVDSLPEWAQDEIKSKTKEDIEYGMIKDGTHPQVNEYKTLYERYRLEDLVLNRPDYDTLSQYVEPAETKAGKKGYNTRFVDQVNNNAPEIFEPIVNDPNFYNNNPNIVNEYEYAWKKANSMTDEEKKVYTALYNAEQKGLVDSGSSDAYLTAIGVDARASEEYQKRIAKSAKENPIGASIASVLTAPLEIPATVMDIANAINGENVNTNDYYHQIGRSNATARSAISEDMSNFGSFLYNTGMSMLDTGYNLALGGGGIMTSTLMALGATGDAITAAKDRGATDSQAVMSGLFAGAAEAFFESFSLGNLKSISKSGGSGVKNFFKNALKQGGVEASEEVFTEIANEISDYMINGGASEFATLIEKYMQDGLSYKEASKKAAIDGAIDLFEAAAGGFISGGVFGTIGSTSAARKNYKKGKSIIESGAADQLKTDAAAFDPNSAVGKRLFELNKKEIKSGKASAAYTGALAQAISEATYADLSTEEKASIETYVKDTLTERGIDADEDTVRAVSKSLFGTAYGNADLTEAERRIVDRVNLTEEIQSELRRMETGEEQQPLKLEKRNVHPTNEENIAQSESVQEKISKMKVVAEGAGINSLSVKENGDVYIDNGGEPVLAADAELTEEAAEAVAYSEGMSPAKKQAFFEEYSSLAKTMTIDEYHTAFDLAYTYGINGMSVDQAVKYAGPVLSDRKAFEIYKKGAEQRGQIKSAIKENNEEIAKVLGENVAKGKVNDKAVRYNKLAPGDPRRAIVAFARVMAHATGRNITFYQSTEKQQAEGMENGRYDPKTNTLYIDINAGIDEIRGVFEDQVLPTVSHELVHAFRAEDVDGYKALEDLVFAGLKESTGKSRSYLVAAERRRIEEADPKRFEGLSDEQRNAIAAEEITARACEDRLANSRMMKDFIADMENKESGLAQKFSNFLGEAIERVKKLFDQIIKKLSGTSEAQSLAKLTDHLDKIQKQFDSLLEALPAEKMENALAATETEMKSDRSTEAVSEFIASKNRVMKADRSIYESARELLLQAASDEELKKSEVYSPLLREYVSRIDKLDHTYLQLEAAESKYVASIDAYYDPELQQKYKAQVDRLSRKIARIEKDLLKQEENKELKAIVRREKAQTLEQAVKEGKKQTAQRMSEYRDSVERKSVLDRVNAKVRNFEKKLKKNTRKEHIPDDLKKPIERLIAAINGVNQFKEASPVPEKEKRKWLVETKNALRELNGAMQQNAQYDVASDKKSSGNENEDDIQYSELLMIDEYILKEMEAIASYIESVLDADEGFFTLSEMDLEKLKGLDRVLASVSRALNNVDKALASQGKQSISQIAEEDMRNMLSFAKDKTKKSTIATMITWSQMTPYTAFSMFGNGGKQIYMNLLKGWGDYARYANSVIEFSDQTWDEEQVKKWSSTVNTYNLNGQEFEATPAQIMYLYCLNKRDQGLFHLNKDGFQIGPIKVKGKIVDAKALSDNAIKSSRSQRNAFFDKHIPVGSDERKVADAIQRFLSETCADWGNELSYKLYGYRAFTDPNYVPIIVDPTKLSVSAGDFETGMYSMFNKGFMKPLNEKAGNAVHAVDLFDVFATHAADMAKYRALGLPVLDAIHYMNYTPIEQLEDGTVRKKPDNMRTVMQATYGPAAFQYVKKFIKDLNESAKTEMDATESAYASLVKSYKTAAVGFNVKVAVLQGTSYYRALSVLSGKSMTKAFALLAKEKTENAFDKEKVLKYSELAEKYSGMALWKSLGYYDVGIGRSLASQIKHDETLKDKTIEIAMKGAEYGDKWTLGVLFKACCIEVQKNGIAKTQKEIFQAAGQLLDEVIVRTQVVDSTMTRSQAMRNKSQLSKMLTSFMSEPTVGYNLLLQECYKVSNDMKKGVKPKEAFLKHKISIGKAFGAYTLTALAAAVVETFFAGIRDDDEEDLEEIAKTFGLKFYENMNPITKVPLVADLWEYIESFLLDEKMYSDNMAYASIEEAVALVQSIIKIAENGITANGMYGIIEGVANTSSYATGIPFGNAFRTVKRAWNNTIGEFTGKKFGVKEPPVMSQIEKAFEKNEMQSLTEALVADKFAELEEERPNADIDELKKRAISSVKASVSKYFKDLYLEAYEDNDRSTMKKIELAMDDTGLYEDLFETLQNWIEAYEKDKKEKGLM